MTLLSRGRLFVRAGAIVVAICSTAADMPPISVQARTAIDRTIGAKGTYVDEESAYKFAFPRTDLTIQVGKQRLSPIQAPWSWATFAPAKQQEGALNGEVIVVEDEVNRVMSAALNAGLEVTALGGILLSEQPRLLAMSVWQQGAYRHLAGALRKTLDEVGHAATSKAGTSPTAVSPPVANNIDAAPLNAVLSMRGVATDGIIDMWKQGTAIELARGVRYALDVEVGAAKVAANVERLQ
jgi:uncharacterized protein DUF1259